jgi:hypothetical protein
MVRLADDGPLGCDPWRLLDEGLRVGWGLGVAARSVGTPLLATAGHGRTIVHE